MTKEKLAEALPEVATSIAAVKSVANYEELQTKLVDLLMPYTADKTADACF